MTELGELAKPIMVATFACAVCLDAFDESDECKTPCCDSRGTMRYCQTCITRVCRHGSDGVGRCPSCRRGLRLSREGEEGMLQVAAHPQERLDQLRDQFGVVPTELESARALAATNSVIMRPLDEPSATQRIGLLLSERDAWLDAGMM